MLFERLFSPLRLGPVTIPNRIVMAPHGVAFPAGYGGAVDRVIDYHVERAKGGAGLIVMSNFLFPPSWRRLASWGGNLETSPLGTLDRIDDPDLVPSYRRLVEGVHAAGARFVSQLNASGRQLHPPGARNFNIPLVAPSALPCPRTREIPRAMAVEDIEEYVATFVTAALNVREAGGDGVELFAAQGYLLHEFLSPLSNRRQDRYGGDLSGRMRFLLDSLAAIRRAVGAELAVGVRLNVEDGLAGGIDRAMAQAIAERLAASGLVDYLNLSGLTSASYPGWIGDMTAPEAQFAEGAAAIRKRVPGLPVCVASRIATPEQAERILADGQADMIGLARALISDPEWPNKARAGLGDDIRRCTYSNQSCLMGLDQGRGVGCVHNVAVGRERQLGIGTMRPAPRPKRVAVVGGGPAGMAAARIAEERGHAVTLFERAERLGGQNLMTSAMAARRDFAEVTRWQERRLRRSRVDLRLGRAVEADELVAAGFDAVILATGSRPRRDGWSPLVPDRAVLPGSGGDRVFTVWDVFRNPGAIGHRVVLVEEDTQLAGAFVAEHLADQGRAVRLLTPHLHAAAELHLHHAPALYRRLGAKGVEVLPHGVVTGLGDGVVHGRDRFSHREWTLSGVDAVVLSMGNESETGLAEALKGRIPELHTVGDCVAPRLITDAILEGERAAWML